MGERAQVAVGLKLLLDEMHAPSVAALLRDLGHEAVAVKERDLPGSSAWQNPLSWNAGPTECRVGHLVDS